MKPPTTLHEALRLAADLAEHNDELERQLYELRVNHEFPEVLRPEHMRKLFYVGKSTISEWVREWEIDPMSSPLLNKGRKKGESVLVLKADLYQWLKTRGVAN